MTQMNLENKKNPRQIKDKRPFYPYGTIWINTEDPTTYYKQTNQNPEDGNLWEWIGGPFPEDSYFYESENDTNKPE